MKERGKFMSTKVKCKNCGGEMDLKDKVCPSCGAKVKRPLYEKWWFWLIVAIISISIISSIVGSDDTGKQTPSNTPIADTAQANSNAATAVEQTPTPTPTPTAPPVPAEYKSALKKAKSYSDVMHMSKQGIYDQLTSEYGEKFPADAAQYAIDNLEADWNKNALEKAKVYRDTMSMSNAAIHDQLTSEYGEKFTKSEADYAIANLGD